MNAIEKERLRSRVADRLVAGECTERFAALIATT
jgi:hypothetical protein